jgi:hypothetical protein
LPDVVISCDWLGIDEQQEAARRFPLVIDIAG